MRRAAGAGTTSVRNTVHFDGNGIASSVLVLLGYLAFGALGAILIRRRAAAIEPMAEAETSAAAVVVP